MSNPTVPLPGPSALPDHFLGNADIIGAEPGKRGWFMGTYHSGCHPILAGDEVELKWGIHSTGQRRHDWSQEKEKWSLSVLIEGDFSIEFDGTTYTLIRPGDFVVWQPGVRHTWRANNKSVVLTVRWRGRKEDWVCLEPKIAQAVREEAEQKHTNMEAIVNARLRKSLRAQRPDR